MNSIRVNVARVSVHNKPNLGLVCITRSPELRYRTVTRKTYLGLGEAGRDRLEEIYRHNLDVLFRAVAFCAAHDIQLYRVSAKLFPLATWKDGVGAEVLKDLELLMAPFGDLAQRRGVRVLVHPDQFVVLNSERPEVVVASIKELEHHAYVFDKLGLPRSPWALMNIHGGKGGRSEALTETISALPENIKSRLTLENDEHIYSAAEILEVCQRTGVPMVFDAHHHVVKEGLAGLEDASVGDYTEQARATWTPPEWQLVHLSNGKDGPQDRRHSDFIEQFPSAFERVEWVELEAKAKEEAIFALRRAGARAVK